MAKPAYFVTPTLPVATIDAALYPDIMDSILADAELAGGGTSAAQDRGGGFPVMIRGWCTLRIWQWWQQAPW